MKYFDFIEHLRDKCQGIIINCPNYCSDKEFNYLELKNHLNVEGCPKILKICKTCNEKVNIEQISSHKCTYESYIWWLKSLL